MVTIVFGLPGSGKSYFAVRLSKELRAEYISSDRVRNELFASKSYTEKEKQDVYKTMLQRTVEALNKKHNVVVDATFYKQEIRDDFNSINDPLHYIEVRADENTIKERLKKPRSSSDADFEVYKKIKAQWEPITERHLTLESTNRNLESMISKALQYLNHDTRRNK